MLISLQNNFICEMILLIKIIAMLYISPMTFINFGEMYNSVKNLRLKKCLQKATYKYFLVKNIVDCVSHLYYFYLDIKYLRTRIMIDGFRILNYVSLFL